ncbi:MAG: SDR family NAD(P)-dependent oxidoreductase [Cocleimonas sp.]
MNELKTAWIIGASSGIGKSFSELLAKNNWQVAISSRSKDKLDNIAAQHENIYAFPLDITDIETLANSRDAILKQLGSIDSLFINAGDYTPMPLEEFDPALFNKLMAINFHGAVNSLDTVLPYMKEKQSGEIYITGSLAGYRGLPKAAPYNASKAAVISLAESLHLELKLQGISIRVINPGFVESPLTSKNDFKMPFLISPEEAAEYIYKELPKNNFEIAFPKRFAYIMKTLRLLPYRLYFALTKASAKPTNK